MKAFTEFKGNITRYWWIPLITGLLSIGIGIWCLCSPESSLPVLSYAFAGVLTFAGILNIAFAFANRRMHIGWGWSLAMGLLEIVTGIWMFCMPPLAAASVFIYAVGLWLIVVCINGICEAMAVYSYSSGWLGFLLTFLLLTMLFSFIFLAGPIAGGVAVWLYIGISLIFFGAYRITVAARLRSWNKNLD